MRRASAAIRTGLIAVTLFGGGGAAGGAAELPPGFTETLLTGQLDGATALDVLPDGRILVAEQRGFVRLVPADGGNPQTIHELASINRMGERGLLGIVVDPAFEANGFFYVYYTTNDGGLHNRISRLRLQGSSVVGGETVLFDFQHFSDSIFHMGGAMRFAADGTLFVGVGDHFLRDPAQDLGSAFGKIHRFAADGSIPPDNPFLNQPGALASIYAYGLRNPYSVDVDPATGELLINDVGQSTWEEIDLGEPGANYGWPGSEGPNVGPNQVAPAYAYRHQGGACAIVGGVSYPASGPFPQPYAGTYLFADLCAGWIRSLDRNSGTVRDFATDVEFPNALRLDRAGRLLYLARATDGGGNIPGKLYRVAYSADPSLLPQIVEPPVDTLAAVGESATFTVVATGALTYQWQRNGVDLPGAHAATLHFGPVTVADDGARFRVRVGNEHGSVLSAEATLEVTSNRPPVVVITSPSTGTGYEIGAHLLLAGFATDPEDGTEPGGRLTWRVDLHHDAHIHPLMPDQSGTSTLDFVVPPEADHGDGVVWLEVVLTAVDLGGRSASASASVFPQSALDGATPEILALGAGSHLASLEFQNPHTGLPQTAIALPATADSGGFWFFGEENLEMLLKVIDGTGYNGCRWIFSGGLTDVEYDLFVVETATGSIRTYSNPLGTQASFGDIEAFCGAIGAAPLAQLAPIPAGEGSDVLALLGGRFRLRVEWRNPWTGETGTATAAPFTDESGFFTFFSSSNLEIAVKMVDGVTLNGHFWVYWTALTNLETRLTIEDSATLEVRSFDKAGETFGSGADILAFPADPAE